MAAASDASLTKHSMVPEPPKRYTVRVFGGSFFSSWTLTETCT